MIDPAPVGLAPQELEVPPSESTGPIQEANRLDQEMLPSILAEPPFPSSGHRDDGMGDPIVERSPFVDEGLTPSSSEERTADVGSVITSSVGSPGLSSPMPWEQIETSTIRIEEAAPSTAPLAQSAGAPLLGSESVLAPSAITQPESVSDQLASPAPAPDLTEPSESIFAAEPSTSPAVLPEPEVPTPSTADSSSTVPFSWNTVFDGAWKFAAGTLSSSSPAAFVQAGYDFTGCEGLRISSTRIGARTRDLCPIHYINSRTARLIQRSRAVASGSSFDLE